MLKGGSTQPCEVMRHDEGGSATTGPLLPSRSFPLPARSARVREESEREPRSDHAESGT